MARVSRNTERELGSTMKLWKIFCAINLIFLCSIQAQASATNPDDNRRFSVVDVSLQLIALPEPLDFTAIEQFILACEVFLESIINVPPITLAHVEVDVGSQTVADTALVGGRDGTYEDLLPITANLEILLEYQLPPDDLVKFIDMERIVKGAFSTKWAELLSLLKLLDASYFSSLSTIELLSPINADDDYNADQSTPVDDKGKSARTILLYVLIGIGVILAIAFALPHVLKRRAKKRHACPQQIEIFKPSTKALSPCNVRRPAKNSSETSSSVPVGISSSSTSEAYMEDQIHRTHHVQRVYSDDKVSSTLSGLRLQKAHSEDVLKQKLGGIQKACVVLGDVPPEDQVEGDLEDVVKDTDTDTTNHIGRSKTSTTSTSNESHNDGSENSLSHGDGLAGLTKTPQQQAPCNTPGTGCARPRYITAPSISNVEVEVSTLAGGDSSSVDSNDEENESVAFVDGSLSEQDMRRHNGWLDPTGSYDVFYTSAADDFGSIARSIPVSDTDDDEFTDV